MDTSPPDLAQDLQHEIKSRVWALRSKVGPSLRKSYRRTDPETVDEAMNTGAVCVLENLQAVADDFIAKGAGADLDDCIAAHIRKGACTFLNSDRGHSRNAMSLSTPIGNDDSGELTLGNLAISSRYTEADMERYVDAMQFSRAASNLNRHETKILFDLADGVTAETAAEEMGLSPAEVRRDRSRVIETLKRKRGSP